MAMSERTYVSYTLRMASSVAVGVMDMAVDCALQACDEREPFLIFMVRTFPEFERLVQYPQFAEVIRRLALPK